MKRRNIVLGILLSSLCLGASTFALSKNNTLTQVKAGYRDNVSVYTGYYQKITDPSTIEDGEDLLLMSNSTATFQHMVGASYHYFINTEEGEIKYFSDDLLYLNNNKTELITFYKTGNNFNLYLKHYVDNADYGAEKSGYIVHEKYNNNGVTSYGDLYIRSNKNASGVLSSEWSLTYSGNNMYIRSTTDRLLNYKVGSGYMWDAFIASTWNTSNVNLYRKVNPTSAEVGMINPKVTRYGKTGVINTTGLGIYFTVPSPIEGEGDVPRYVYINDYSRFFEIDREFNYESAGTYERTFKYLPKNLTFTYEIEIVDSPVYHFTRVPDDEIDFRGTYLLVAEESKRVYNAYAETADYPTQNGSALDFTGDLDAYDGVLSTSDFNLYEYGEERAAFRIAFNMDDPAFDTYYMMTYDNNSCFRYRDGSDEEFNSHICKGGRYYGNNITVVNASIKFGDKYLKYDTYNRKFIVTSNEGSNYEKAKLYRLDLTTDVINEANYYRENYFAYIRESVCDMNGNTDLELLQNNWFRYKYFEYCSPTTQYYFTHLVYTHNSHPVDSSESLVDCYDYVLSKYEDLNLQDYMFRKNVGTYQPSYSGSNNNIKNIIFGSNDYAIISTVLVIIGLTFISGFIFISFKKKKQQ